MKLRTPLGLPSDRRQRCMLLCHGQHCLPLVQNAENLNIVSGHPVCPEPCSSELAIVLGKTLSVEREVSCYWTRATNLCPDWDSMFDVQ